MDTIEIIKCKIGDLKSISSFYDNVVLHLMNNTNFPKWEYGVYPSTESVKKAIEEDSQYMCVENSRILGAFILNDKPLGAYECGDWQRNLKEGEYLVIHTLATSPDSYGQGVGKFMVSYCIDYAKNHRYKAIRLDVVPENIPARRLYEKLSFTFAGEKDLKCGIEDIPTFALYEMNF